MKKFTKKTVLALVFFGAFGIITFGGSGPQGQHVQPIAIVADNPDGNGGPNGH